MRDKKQLWPKEKDDLTAGEVLWYLTCLSAHQTAALGNPVVVLWGTSRSEDLELQVCRGRAWIQLRLQQCSIGSAASVEGSQDRIDERGEVEDGGWRRASTRIVKFTRRREDKCQQNRRRRRKTKTVLEFFGDGLIRLRLGAPKAEGQEHGPRSTEEDSQG